MKQRYDSYKPSGIDWIGDIPSHWDILPLKRISTMFGRIGYRGYTVQDLRVEGEGAITLSPSNMSNGGMNYENVSYLSWEKFHESPEIKIQEGDILFVKTGSTFGKTSYVDELPMEATINPQILRIVPSIHKKYLAYCMGTPYSQALTDCYVVGSTIPTISQESIGKFVFCVPPLAEQEAIAAWLDEKCEDIDAAIAKVDREIELIDELKQSEISRVVTRGLNPDAPLCPSGIDWIGDIPEHWTKCRLKFIGSARNGLTYSPSDVKDSGKLVIRSSNIQDSKLNYDDCVFVANYPETLSVNSGDTIICSRNGSINLIGKSVFIEDDMDVTFGAFMMRFRPYEHPKYSHYLLSIAISRYKGLFATTTINQLTADSLGKMEAVMPPYMEQVQIADYLDKKCAAIDGLKAKLIKKRETLTELRQSIISEVVTGKRKVI